MKKLIITALLATISSAAHAGNKHYTDALDDTGILAMPICSNENGAAFDLAKWKFAGAPAVPCHSTY